jgi:hypothetical protein
VRHPFLLSAPCPAVPLLQVSESHLHTHCEACGGALENTIAPQDMRSRVVVFSNCGAYYKFELLRQLADTVLGDGSLPPV